ncbi:MAG: hypothetical protein NZ932_06055 [Candidatus Bathyarchaeota archaeon]|nr:hypothetical protein [Candidatus Bathyarchaeota archaeon]MDW8040895.1 hypothetical protein [Nitrososphaerota archaeon]
MRLTVKALGWIIILLWIIALALPLSVAFSLLKLAEGKNLGIQEPSFTFFNGNVSINMPMYVNNTGLYDISEVNVKINIKEAKTVIMALSKSLPDIPAGQVVKANCTFTANLKEIFQKAPTLLTEDADLNVNAALHFRMAYTIAFNITQSFSTRWGAPFHNLTVSNVVYNAAAQITSFFVSFSNHAFFSLDNPLTVELYNSHNEMVGAASLALKVPSGEAFQEPVEVAVNPSKMTETVFIRLFFAELKIFDGRFSL